MIAHGVDRHVFQVSMREMEEMFLIEHGVNSADEQTVSLFNPAMADIAYDVCTPEQIASICLALNERLKPIQDTDFRIPFLMANFTYRLEEDELLMTHFWKKGYRMLLRERETMPNSAFQQILECIGEEIASYDYDPKEVLDADLVYPGVNENHVGMNLLLVKFYIGVSDIVHGVFCAEASLLTHITMNCSRWPLDLWAIPWVPLHGVSSTKGTCFENWIWSKRASTILLVLVKDTARRLLW